MGEEINRFKEYIGRVLFVADFPKDKITSYVDNLTNQVMMSVFLDLPKEISDKNLQKINLEVKDKNYKRALEMLDILAIPQIFQNNLSAEFKKCFLDFSKRIKEVAYEQNKQKIQDIIDEFQANMPN